MGPIRALGLRALCTGGYEASRTSLCIGTGVGVCQRVSSADAPVCSLAVRGEEGRHQPIDEVQVFGRWAATYQGANVRLGKNERLILHALILARQDKPITRTELIALLDKADLGERNNAVALRNTLRNLRRRGLNIGEEEEVSFPHDQLTVDLWELRKMMGEQLHDKADVLRGDAEHLASPTTAVASEEPFALAELEFNEILETLRRLAYARTTRIAAMKQMREELLARELVPGLHARGGTTIGEIRKLDPLRIAWSAKRIRGTLPSPLPVLIDYVNDTLADLSGPPDKIVVIAPPGFGKALTAIATYLRLTEGLDDPRRELRTRTVLLVDARAELSDPDFGSEVWLEARLEQIGALKQSRPIVIISHADAFLAANHDRLLAILNAGVFARADLLLTCNEQFHSKKLAYAAFGTHEIKLEEWDGELQAAYVGGLYGADTLTSYEAWRDRDDSREVLCRVPLHMHYVVSLLHEEPDALEAIDRRWDLFEEMARVRLRASGLHDQIDSVMDDLASLAHEHYRPGDPVNDPIEFTERQLLANLEQRNVADAAERARALMHNTLLDERSPGRGKLRFRDALWGYFFVAYHIQRLLSSGLASTEEVLASFEKFLAAAVMDRCEESLVALPNRDETIIPALLDALLAAPPTGIGTDRRLIAREQIAYLLGAFADTEQKAELLPMLNPDSPAWEREILVRRALAVGLSNAGHPDVASDYVSTLRAEIDAGGETPQADANIGFVLTFRGDQPFNARRPGAIAPKPDPEQTVSDLLRGLERIRHSGTWQIKLFTLLDLARVAPDLTRGYLSDQRDRVAAILDRLEARATVVVWREIAEMRTILEQLPSSVESD